MEVNVILPTVIKPFHLYELLMLFIDARVELNISVENFNIAVNLIVMVE